MVVEDPKDADSDGAADGYSRVVHYYYYSSLIQ